MQPITVSVRVARPRDEVFAFLDVLANHEPFTDHMLTEWSFTGPAAGVGARARMHATLPGPKDWMAMEVLESRPPVTTAEESVSAKGRRRTRGTYTLDALPDGGTHVRFELRYLKVPLRDRLMAPFIRRWLRRGNERAMVRLGETLSSPAPVQHAA